MASIQSSLTFLARFLRHPSTVGAFWPSSRKLASVMAADLPVQAGDLIVELGAGSGPVTELLHGYVQAGHAANYLGIERDPVLGKVLIDRFPSLQFHIGDAGDLPKVLAERGLPAPKAIISGLPFGSMPAEVALGLLAMIRDQLQPGGLFRTYSYLHTYALPGWERLRKMVSETFARVERNRTVLRNLPPALVCTGWK